MRIWGIPEHLETLDTDRLNLEISNMRAQIKGIRDYLKYADGGAYSQDMNRISQIDNDIRVLAEIIKTRIKT